jgi:hypothetical protein
MLRQSRAEFGQWKNNRNIVFLQQACEKVFNALEELSQVRSLSKFESHGDFRSTFRQLKFPSNVLSSAEELHKFFYNGESFEKDTKYIESSYLVVYNFLLKQKV